MKRAYLDAIVHFDVSDGWDSLQEIHILGHWVEQP